MARKDADVMAFLGQLGEEAKLEQRRQEIVQAIQRDNSFAYRWATINERNRNFQPQNFSGDSAAYSATGLMTHRLRDQIRNDAVMKSIPIKLADRVIGTGLRTFSDPIDVGIAVEDESYLEDQLEQALEMDDEHLRFYEDKYAFDVEGKHAGPDMERAGFREQVVTGDTLIIRCFMKRPNIDTPLCYQLVERDQLDTRQDRPADANGLRCVHGIELDKYNRAVAYHIYDAHPGDNFQPFQSTTGSRRIPAERVIHAAVFTRPSQNIGVSWLDAIGQDTFDEDKVVSAELQTMAKQALLAFYVNRKNPYSGGLGLSIEEDCYPRAADEVRLGSSPLGVELGLDEKLGIVESATRPNMNICDWLDYMAHRKAAGVGLSYYSLAGKYSNTNYTGFRGALLDEDLSLHPIQRWFGREVCLPIRREFNEIAAALGLYKRLKPREFMQDKRRFQTFDLVSAGRQYLEPEAETDANMAALRSRLTTLKIECAKRGLHYIRVLMQARLEKKLLEMFGLVADFSKGQGGQNDGSTVGGAAKKVAPDAAGGNNSR